MKNVLFIVDNRKELLTYICDDSYDDFVSRNPQFHKIFHFFIKNKIIRLIMENILHRRGAVMHKNPVRQLHDTHNVISSH